MPVSPVPSGYPTVVPYLAVDGAARAIAFYTQAFGARERMRLPGPDGKLGHAEIEIGDSLVMLADPSPGHNFAPPKDAAVSVSIHLYLADVDAVVARAVAAGASIERPVETMFYGDRTGTLRCPFGHRWHVATHVEDVTSEEMQRRMANLRPG